MRVIVTGGSGRAGQHVVRELVDAGHEVVNIDMVNLAGLPAEFCRIDLTDLGEVYDAFFQFRPEGVCHLAANPAPSGQARVDVFDNNVRSTYNVMQAAGDLGVAAADLCVERDGDGPVDRWQGPYTYSIRRGGAVCVAQRLRAQQVSERGHRESLGPALSEDRFRRLPHQQCHPTRALRYARRTTT